MIGKRSGKPQPKKQGTQNIMNNRVRVMKNWMRGMGITKAMTHEIRLGH
jgi:hypothetical protein